MQTINVSTEGSVSTITLNNGKVNAISPQTINEINAALDEAEKNEYVVIITGQPGMFCAGYDLKTMKESPEAAISLVTAGSTLAHRMLSFPCPIIAACSGHAVAKGGFLLLSCDYRIGIEGNFKIGLNEVAIGMTMHHAGIEIARNRIPVNFLNRSVINAEMFNPQTAIQAGFLDTVVEAEQLMSVAKLAAKQMQGLHMTAFRQTKLKERQASLAALDNAIATDADEGFMF
ncbi:MAG: crotonase/enoyl-CoA hydratase family protein [Litorilituus sp.]|jgi:enoyl-CoA hydratase|nr:crotonase/enoyl-CoA hydratase family protein [Litorilituus sp.]